MENVGPRPQKDVERWKCTLFCYYPPGEIDEWKR
jgi:hypothetical protein